MFYVNGNSVYVNTDNGDVELCHVNNLPLVIHELTGLNLLINEPTPIDEEKDEEDVSDRFTLEGIDRFFTAEVGFLPSIERWAEDSKTNWMNIEGTELFNRYQKHAECYCSGCLDINCEPTYEGFRTWLVTLRDLDNG